MNELDVEWLCVSYVKLIYAKNAFNQLLKCVLFWQYTMATQ